MKDLKKIQKFFSKPLNEVSGNIDIEDFAKVVQAISQTNHPVTVMLTPMFGKNEIEILIGIDAPDPISRDIFDIMDNLGYKSGRDYSISGDSSTLSRREYSDIRRVNGGHKDYWEESVNEGGVAGWKKASMSMIKHIQKQLDDMGVKYEMGDTPYAPFKTIYKPINKSDDWYDKFDDLIWRANLRGVVKTAMDELDTATYRSALEKGRSRGDSKGRGIATNALNLLAGKVAQTLAGQSFEVAGSRENLAKGFYRGNSQKFINQFLMTFTGEGRLVSPSKLDTVGGDEVHFRMNVEFQNPDNIGGFSTDVKFRGYEKYKFPGTVQFSIKEGNVWVWYNAAETDLEFTRVGARAISKLADMVAQELQLKTPVKHNSIKQFDPMKPSVDEASKEEENEFHTKLDNLVHKTFGPSSDEKKKEMNEAYVPSNIAEFAKRRGISPLVRKVAGWAERVGARITGGTAIGKGYNTLILDLGYQTGDIRIDVEDETIELYDEPIYSFADFKNVFMEEVSRQQAEHDEEQLRRERGLEEKAQEIAETIKLGLMLNEELCPKGKAYIKRRLAAGEKSSAYLSGRAVKVCKGQMSGRSKKK